MSNKSYECGTFRLKETIENSKPDRRAKYDWRLHTEWKKGSIFHVEKMPAHGFFVLRMGNSSYRMYSYEDTFDIIYQCLEPIKEDPYTWLNREGWAHMGDSVLRNLFAKGHFTMEDFIKAVEEELNVD